MKKIFLIITLLFNSVLYAKNNNDTINLAEQTIIDEDYGKALGLYLAKSKTDKMHTIDIHNALVCAILTKDEDAKKININKFTNKKILDVQSIYGGNGGIIKPAPKIGGPTRLSELGSDNTEVVDNTPLD